MICSLLRSVKPVCGQKKKRKNMSSKEERLIVLQETLKLQKQNNKNLTEQIIELQGQIKNVEQDILEKKKLLERAKEEHDLVIVTKLTEEINIYEEETRIAKENLEQLETVRDLNNEEILETEKLIEELKK
jgi:hypothetical protein